MTTTPEQLAGVIAALLPAPSDDRDRVADALRRIADVLDPPGPRVDYKPGLTIAYYDAGGAVMVSQVIRPAIGESFTLEPRTGLGAFHSLRTHRFE